MVKMVIDFIKKMKEDIKKLMIKIIEVSFGICIFAATVLFAYILNTSNIVFYEAGIILFKTGIIFAVFGFLCSFAVENLRKNIL